VKSVIRLPALETQSNSNTTSEAVQMSDVRPITEFPSIAKNNKMKLSIYLLYLLNLLCYRSQRNTNES
jgi:hypothetical protein